MSTSELILENEPQRLAAVRRYDILDSPADGSFDRITALAARLFDVPISIISIVDHDRIWFKSHHGIDAEEIDREPGLCASAILKDVPWIVTDAKKDVRTLSNPLVCGALGLQFYAGVPLKSDDGYALGTLNIIDKNPRTLSRAEIETLETLAGLVMDALELRLSARRLYASVDERRRRGVELNDDVVQDLSVAKLSLDMGDLETASAALSRALSASMGIASKLLDEETGGPVAGRLVRERPAGEIQRSS